MVKKHFFSLRNSGFVMRESSFFLKMCLLFVFLLFAGTRAVGQSSERISMQLNNVSLEAFFDAVSSRAGVTFSYDPAILQGAQRVSVNATSESWGPLVKRIVEPVGYAVEITGKTAYISKRGAGKGSIKGVVEDELGDPLIGVNVRVKERPSVGVITGIDGDFAIEASSSETLIFSYVGMKSQEVKLQSGKSIYNVTMKSDTQLEEVVIEAGIVQINKAGFTGSANTVTKEELKAVGNMNVLQTLKSLDASLVFAENSIAGSNPNGMATISLRGGSTMDFQTTLDDNTSNPNEPLFLLDGFETTLEIVNDLDINRIESITILKDAGSTAIYGSKGANGVVVVETIKPKEGEVMINYNGDFQLAAADLSVYNMMNASEKLEFERLSGRYGDLNDFIFNRSNIELYNRNVGRIAEGIDTYWLKIPLRTSFTHNHSLQVSGGGNGFLYQIGANYKKYEGVMKDSSRETFGGNVNLTYRSSNFNITNNTTVSITNAHDGSWGSFSAFANANPYFKKENEDGTIPMLLDEIYTTAGAAGVIDDAASNPYYNATLLSRSDNNTFDFRNNTGFNYSKDNFRWRSSFSIFTSKSDNVVFKDPRHTSYRNNDYTLQGSYSSSYGTSWGYNGNTTLTYTFFVNEDHNFTINGRAAIEERHSDSKGFVARGFPKGVDGIPSFAYGFEESSRPSYSENINRLASFLGMLNYNYKLRYLFDFSYSMDGSTAFGAKERFRDFWSVGLGWNVDREPFAEAWKDNFLQELKLRTNYGVTGNQNVSNVSETVYYYYSGSDIFGTGSYLHTLANPYLEWQVAKKYGAGIDLSMLNKRLTLTFDYYYNITDPMVVALSQQPSSGIGSYPVNMGRLKSNGIEWKVGYYFIRNLKERITLQASLTGRKSKQRYDGFMNRLTELNNLYAGQQDEEGNTIPASQNLNSLIKYEDGYGPSTLWAVRSLGIDPATGKEVFLTKEGLPTFEYNARDRVAIGERNPDMEGVFSLNFNYKKLQFNAFFRYRLGGHEFNNALYNKVENISKGDIIYNQDKRALYDRWQKPGDVSKFKNINLTNMKSTPVSARFIQKNNQFIGESFKISWDFSKDQWIQKFAVKDLRVSVSMADVFMWKSMKAERGIDYPFQRAITGSVSARF